jgi:hypothetical protein
VFEGEAVGVRLRRSLSLLDSNSSEIGSLQHKGEYDNNDLFVSFYMGRKVKEEGTKKNSPDEVFEGILDHVFVIPEVAKTFIQDALLEIACPY